MGLAMPVGPDEVDHRATYRAGAWIAADEEAGQGQPADRMGDGDREARRAQIAERRAGEMLIEMAERGERRQREAARPPKLSSCASCPRRSRPPPSTVGTRPERIWRRR